MGKAWSVQFYTDRHGKRPASEFLNALPPVERAEAARAILLLEEFGVLLGMPHARPISGHPKLWELRAGPNRIFYFAHAERVFVLLHAYRKQSQKAPAREIAIAERRMAELREEP
jgi:phage-related protein